MNILRDDITRLCDLAAKYVQMERQGAGDREVEEFLEYVLDPYCEAMTDSEWPGARSEYERLSREAGQELGEEHRIPLKVLWRMMPAEDRRGLQREMAIQAMPWLAGLEYRDSKDVRLLWHDGFYDGPLSGMVRLRTGETLYCVCEHEFTEHQGTRVFVLYELGAELLARHKWRHAIWRWFVGPGCDYDEKGERIPTKGPRPLWRFYFRVVAPILDRWLPNDLAGAKRVGWFVRW